MGQVIGRREETPIFYFFCFLTHLYYLYILKSSIFEKKITLLYTKIVLVVDYYQRHVRF